MTTIGIAPGKRLTSDGVVVKVCHMSYNDMTRQQRYVLRKKGHDVPHKPRPSIKGFNTKAHMTCAGCNASFIGIKDPESKSNYCSVMCYRTNLSGSDNPNFKGDIKNKKCKGCSNLFNQTRSKYQSDYCSRQCSEETLLKRAEKAAIRKRIRDNVRRSILSYVKRGTKNNRKWQSILGYTTKDLCNHLQSNFTPEMNWDNYGSYWHIDHITPVSWFKFDTPDSEAFRKCWSINNLQPLEAKANIRKGNKLCLV